jgi:acyl carrier protein
MANAISVEDVGELVRKQLRGKLPPDARLDASAEFETLGLSSLDVTEIFFGIEEKVGFELDPTAGADVKTIGDLVDVVNGTARAEPVA